MSTDSAKQRLLSEIRFLRIKWGVWKRLFTSHDGVDALNLASALTGRCIQDALQTDILLGLARALDPATQGSNENVSVERFTDGELCSTLEEFRDKLKAARNKRVAHNDLLSIQAQHQVAFGVTDTEVDAAFESMRRHLEQVEEDVDIWMEEGRKAAESLIKSLVTPASRATGGH